MNTDQILAQLQVEQPSVVFDFFIVYSRFEYALKRAGYIIELRNGVRADWPCFISDIRDNFDQNRTAELRKAAQYLLENPTEAQVVNQRGELRFEPHPDTSTGPIPLRLYHCVRIARNNLFHGGKFPFPDGPHEDVARDTRLLKSGLIVLEEFLEASDAAAINLIGPFYEGI
jgi:hypothetical protein